MTDKTAIGISSLIALGLITLSMITPSFFEQDNQYYCESRGIIQECTSLSGGTGTRCYINEDLTSWLVCREGWVSIVNDINEELKPPLTPTLNKGVWGKSYTCDSEGCVEVTE